MNSSSVRLVVGICLTILVVGRPAAADDDSFSAPDRSVTLDAGAKARIGIATQTAQATQYNAEARGLGQVLGLEAVAQTDADLTIAESAAHASQAALVRAHGLFGADTGVSRQALEAAEHQATADAAQLALAERKSTAAWGRDAPWRDPEQRHALLAKMAAGDAAIVRATFPENSLGGVPPASVRIERLAARDGETGWTTSTVWAAPADPTVPGRSFFMLVDGAQGLSQGEHVRVVAPLGAPKQGAIVPTGAIVIAEGRTWLYIEEKPDYFVRQAIDLSQPTEDGYFTAEGVRPGESVVTDGAGQLLARETGTED
jgi:hypothetical protein